MSFLYSVFVFFYAFPQRLYDATNSPTSRLRSLGTHFEDNPILAYLCVSGVHSQKPSHGLVENYNSTQASRALGFLLVGLSVYFAFKCGVCKPLFLFLSISHVPEGVPLVLTQRLFKIALTTARFLFSRSFNPTPSTLPSYSSAECRRQSRTKL